MIISNLYVRINHLITDPDCDTLGDEYDDIVWRDGRSQPSIEELLEIAPLLIIAGIEKTREIKDEANHRVELISSPGDTIKAFSKAIRLVRKENKGDASQEDIDTLNAFEAASVNAETIRDAETLMLADVELLLDTATHPDEIKSYGVADSSLWP